MVSMVLLLDTGKHIQYILPDKHPDCRVESVQSANQVCLHLWTRQSPYVFHGSLQVQCWHDHQGSTFNTHTQKENTIKYSYVHWLNTLLNSHQLSLIFKASLSVFLHLTHI